MDCPKKIGDWSESEPKRPMGRLAGRLRPLTRQAKGRKTMRIMNRECELIRSATVGGVDGETWRLYLCSGIHPGAYLEIVDQNSGQVITCQRIWKQTWKQTLAYFADQLAIAITCAA